MNGRSAIGLITLTETCVVQGVGRARACVRLHRKRRCTFVACRTQVVRGCYRANLICPRLFHVHQVPGLDGDVQARTPTKSQAQSSIFPAPRNSQPLNLLEIYCTYSSKYCTSGRRLMMPIAASSSVFVLVAAPRWCVDPYPAPRSRVDTINVKGKFCDTTLSGFAHPHTGRHAHFGTRRFSSPRGAHCAWATQR
jgi:hypothetical protein